MVVEFPDALRATYPSAVAFAEKVTDLLYQSSGFPMTLPRITEGSDGVALRLEWSEPRRLTLVVFVEGTEGTEGTVVVPKISTHISSRDPKELASYVAKSLGTSAWRVFAEELDAMPLTPPWACYVRDHCLAVAKASRDDDGVPVCTYDSQTTVRLSWPGRSVVVGSKGPTLLS